MESEPLKLLDERVLELMRQRGWSKLTQAQREALPLVLEGFNVVIVAPTGYGKTEAALLPILSLMLRENVSPVALLYITPLRALINDLCQRISWWAERLGFRVARKHGDVPQSERVRRLRDAPHILVTTPESLEIDLDWAPKFRRYYANLRWVVVDEVHEIVGTKRGVQLAVLLERLRRIGGDYQLVLLSATVGDPLLVGKAFTGSSKRPLKVVNVGERKRVSITIDLVPQASNFWAEAAKTILEHVEPLTLVFVNSKHVAERLHEALEKMGVRGVMVHHASLSAQGREAIESLAREGKLGIIICTKTLELGIDIGHVAKVIVFRPTGSPSCLIQRIGRSGHTVEGTSVGVVIATDPIELLEAIAEARLAVEGKFESPELPRKPLDMLARALIGMSLAGEYTVEDAYSIVTSVYYFKDLTREEFERVLRVLIENRVVVVKDGRLCAGPTFYKIWRFDSESKLKRAWWIREFSEFFTTIGERESFIVKTEDGKVVGELDSDFVFRTLRVGMILRLGGRNWLVTDVDEHSQKVVVREADAAVSFVPHWRGRGPSVEKLVVEELVKVVDELRKGFVFLPENLSLTARARKVLSEIADELKNVPFDGGTVLVDKVGDEVVFIAPLGEKVVRTLAYALLADASRVSSRNYVRVSFYGFTFKSGDPSYDPLEALMSMDEYELSQKIRAAVLRSPYYAETSLTVKLPFGCTQRNHNLPNIVREEVLRQVLSEHYDLKAAVDVLQRMRRGLLRVIVNTGSSTVYSRYLIQETPEQLWGSGIEEVIADALRGMAFTVEELSDITSFPEKVVESKLKEMRRPTSRLRVFSFVDVDSGEVRWALVDDAEKIVYSEEFRTSFTPRDVDSLYLVMIKTPNGALIHQIVRVSDVAARPERFAESLPVEEVHELKVVDLCGVGGEGSYVKYYHVPRKLVPYLVLNAVSVLQRMRAEAF